MSIQAAQVNTLNSNFHQEIVTKLSKGDQFPLKVKLTGDVFNSNETSLTVDVARTVFIRASSDGLLFRFNDSEDWKDFTEDFTGSLNAGLSIENGTFSTHLNLEANVR